jgi:hypothetical protein
MLLSLNSTFGFSLRKQTFNQVTCLYVAIFATIYTLASLFQDMFYFVRVFENGMIILKWLLKK